MEKLAVSFTSCGITSELGIFNLATWVFSLYCNVYENIQLVSINTVVSPKFNVWASVLVLDEQLLFHLS